MHKQNITIKKIVNGGFGLGHLPSQQVVLVHFGLPGETVTVTTEESNKNYLFGKVVHIEKKHPARIKPPCQYYDSCGGCNLQHCDYRTQVVLKKEIVTDLLVRQNVLTTADINTVVKDVIAAPHPFNYRQRIRLQVKGETTLGFNRFRSNEIVEISKCLLAKPSINNALTGIRAHEITPYFLELSSEMELQHNPASDHVSCIFHFNRKPRPTDLKRAEQLCADIPVLDRIFFSGNDFPMVGPLGPTGDGPTKFLTRTYESIQGLTSPLQLSWEVGGFCQVNLEQNRNMIESVLQFAGATANDTVLDLFCGMGNFAIPMSRLAASVDGYEGQGSSIRCAKKNSANSGKNNTLFVKKPVHGACDQLIEEQRSFDIVILDPPRQGAPELATRLKQLCNKRLVYISCDPATLVRDLKDLMACGFSLKTIQPIDMFPQTHHIETVALLER